MKREGARCVPQQTQEFAIQIADSVVRVIPANSKSGTARGKRRDELQVELGRMPARG